MSSKELVTNDEIQNKIHLVRGVQVILDKDLAVFYGVQPIRLREQVKRNKKRFPPDFMFQLTEEETERMVSQNAIPSRRSLGGSLPLVFTEQGVAAVSAILTGARAIEVNILIMRAFVAMRRFLLANAQVFQRLESLETRQLETDRKMDRVLTAIERKDIQPKQGVFFDGQVFDAYALVSSIVRSAEKSIVLIDNYIDETVLTLFSKKKKSVTLTLLTKTVSKQLALDVAKFSEQYPGAEMKEFADSHDRFLIIDGRTVYHIGASLKDLGKKWFAFSKMDFEAVEMLARLGKAA